MEGFASAFFLLVLLGCVYGQINITTIPNTDDGDAYVFGEEGDLNISMYCEVINNDIQLKVQTSWYLQRQSDSGPPTLVVFDPDGIPNTPSDLADDIIALGEEAPGLGGETFRTNFTILNFTSQFTQALLQCGTSLVRRNFNLGLSGL